MNEDVFNMEVRKFLKKVGVTSQREIEQAVREAIDSGALQGTETLKAKMTLTIDGLNVRHEIDGDISLV
jgi:ribosomal protein L1